MYKVFVNQIISQGLIFGFQEIYILSLIILDKQKQLFITYLIYLIKNQIGI